MKFFLNFLRELGRGYAFMFLFFIGFVLSGLIVIFGKQVFGEGASIVLTVIGILVALACIVLAFRVMFKKPKRLSLREQRLQAEAKNKSG